MHRALVFGCKGQLGRDLEAVFGKGYELEGVDLPEVDITDESAVSRVTERFRPDVILNAAAYTDVEGAEGDEATAFRVNESGARNVAAAAKGVGASVVYYSTDYVFGGTKREPYRERDEVSPIGVYARSKLAGERATSETHANHFIVRTAWLYGLTGNNFVEKILSAAKSRPELRVVEDEVGAPTCSLDLAEATAALVKTGVYGLYHFTNTGSCSRYELAGEILRLAGVETPIVPCASSEFETKAERPLYSVMSTEKLERVTGYRPREWREALADYMTRRTAG